MALALDAAPAHALDKQGSAHGGAAAGAQTGVGVTGSVMLGLSPYNPSYAARPDNSGLALMRYAGHLDVDLIGRRLSVPVDVNMFSDRERGGGRALLPSEVDVIAGVTSTWDVARGAVEAGARVEHDRPADGDGTSQTYGDARVRYLFSLAALAPGAATALRDGDLRAYATAGWFAVNRSYFARPNNSGLALFRYALHAELSLFAHHLAVGADATFFTDRHAASVVRPSELDFTPELIVCGGRFEVHLAYERDMPIDGGDPTHKVQQFVYVLAGWSFGGS